MPTTAYLSVDIEGISGFVHPAQDETDEAAALMVAETNAVIDGILAADSQASITVADSHGRMRTAPIGELDSHASLVRGRNRPRGMVDGATPEHDVACFIGYHDRPGSGGVLEHTFSGSLHEVRIDGLPVGEPSLNAALLADMGVPVGLISGDSRLEATIDERLPSARFVPTKRTRGVQAAECRPPAEVQRDLAAAAEALIADQPTVPDQPIPTDPPYEVTIRFRTVSHAELAALWPEVDRGDDSRVITHHASDLQTAYRFVRAAASVRPRER